MRDIIKRLLNEIKNTKDPELLKKQYGYRPSQTTKGGLGDLYKEREVDVFFSDKYKYHVHVDKFDNHLYLVAFFPHLDSSFFEKQEKLRRRGGEYHDKYTYQTKENIFYDVMTIMLDKCDTILRNDSLSSFSYMGAPDINTGKESDLENTKRFRVYNKIMYDHYKNTHFFENDETYSMSILINKKYIEEITKGLTPEEKTKKYKEYKDYCFSKTLRAA